MTITVGRSRSEFFLWALDCGASRHALHGMGQPDGLRVIFLDIGKRPPWHTCLLSPAPASELEALGWRWASAHVHGDRCSRSPKVPPGEAALAS